MASIPSSVDFLASYPELAGAEPSLVNAKLAEAASRTNADVYATVGLAADAVMLRAAILLYKSPFARKMRADNPEQIVVWERELKQLQRAATIGLRCF